MRKIKIHSEVIYILAILILSFAVAMMTSANLGVSMIVCPAYLISQKLGFLTFGQSEYIVQGVLFIALCIALKRFRWVYLSSFITGIFYGAVLDLWRIIIPHFNPEITPPGSMAFGLRIVYFSLGMIMTAMSVALFFKTYFYPQVYDFFVKAVSGKYGINRTKFKMIFDLCSLTLSCGMTLLFFGEFVGVGAGTIIMTCFNGLLIGMFGRIYDKVFEISPRFEKFEKIFRLDSL